MAPRPDDHAPPPCIGDHLDPGADALLDGRHVRDDADQLFILLQARQRFEGRVQGLLVEATETLVQKQRIDMDVVAGHVGKS